MKLTLALTLASVLLASPLDAATEPQAGACTASIGNLRKILPSACDPTGRVGPDITFHGKAFSADEAHFIVGSPTASGAGLCQAEGDQCVEGTEGGKGTLIVHLPGTIGWPDVSSCLLKSVSSLGHPTIGLGYSFLDDADGVLNTRCASLPLEEQVQCLSERHNDSIYGGTWGAEKGLWRAVDTRDAISGRLGLLLAKLDAENPEEGWGGYYVRASGAYPASLPTPKWSKITFLGHSSGATHAAYLAATLPIRGAGLFSGPQDECTGCPEGTQFWVDGGFGSTKVTAFAHGDPGETMEPALPTMKDNWARMGVWPAPLEVQSVDGYGGYDVCRTPIVSTIAPTASSPCGRMGHCSTGLDDSSPVVTNNAREHVYVFGLDVWRKVADVEACYLE